MLALGGWEAPGPLQGIHLEHLTGNLYHLRAVGIMGTLAPEAIPVAGVMEWATTSPEYHADVEVAPKDIAGYAHYYKGTSLRGRSGDRDYYIIKGIAPQMRREYEMQAL